MSEATLHYEIRCAPDHVAITKSNTTTYGTGAATDANASYLRSLLVTNATASTVTVAVVSKGGTTVSYNVIANSYLVIPVVTQQVLSTGTTATDIKGWY